MSVAISRSLFDAIIADARSDPNAERCGLLFGAGPAITGFAPAANIHPCPARHFELDPASLLSSYRAARNGGPEVIGHYHSHPDRPAIPSLADAADVDDDGRLWLIVGGTGTRLWRSVVGGPHLGCFEPVLVIVETSTLLASPSDAP